MFNSAGRICFFFPQLISKMTAVVVQQPQLPNELVVLARRVERKGKSAIALVSVVFLVSVGILVVVVIMATAVAPIPDTETGGFEWQPSDGNSPEDSISNGNFIFALMNDGNASVVNRVTGQSSSSSIAVTKGIGTRMTFESGTGVLTISTATTALATVHPEDSSSDGHRLGLLVDGTLYIKDSEGHVTPIYATSWKAV